MERGNHAGKVVEADRKRNTVQPSSTARLKNATKIYKEFTGHDGDEVEYFHYPNIDTGAIIGKLDGVLYTTVRDGVVEKYIHEFREKSSPLLAVSHDGKQLLVVGGSYKFTDRGIEDA